MIDYSYLLQLWEEHLRPSDEMLLPLVPLEPANGSLLFVGMNPSFSVSAIQKILGSSCPSEPQKYFSWCNRSNFDPALDRRLHRLAKDEYAYFRRFRKLAKSLCLEWDHHDLFFIRETNQKVAKEYVIQHDRGLTPFGHAQFEAAIGEIRNSKPKAVIIANALASDICRYNLGLRFDASTCCYYDPNGNGDTPFFLASMLTGQRAMDKYSFERLAWHIGITLGIGLSGPCSHDENAT